MGSRTAKCCIPNCFLETRCGIDGVDPYSIHQPIADDLPPYFIQDNRHIKKATARVSSYRPRSYTSFSSMLKHLKMGSTGGGTPAAVNMGSNGSVTSGHNHVHGHAAQDNHNNNANHTPNSSRPSNATRPSIQAAQKVLPVVENSTINHRATVSKVQEMASLVEESDEDEEKEKAEGNGTEPDSAHILKPSELNKVKDPIGIAAPIEIGEVIPQALPIKSDHALLAPDNVHSDSLGSSHVPVSHSDSGPTIVPISLPVLISTKPLTPSQMLKKSLLTEHRDDLQEPSLTSQGSLANQSIIPYLCDDFEQPSDALNQSEDVDV